MPCYRASLRLLAIGLTTGLIAGCGGGSGERLVQVHGTLTNAGKPLEVKDQEVGLGLLQLEFYHIDENGVQTTDPQPARLKPDGSFTVVGRSGKGLPAGKYRIVVGQWDPFPDFDRLGGRFSAERSPLVREIAENMQIDIDVSRPEG